MNTTRNRHGSATVFEWAAAGATSPARRAVSRLASMVSIASGMEGGMQVSMNRLEDIVVELNDE